MKWGKRGHELDKYKDKFINKDMYIYGAGNNGKRLYKKMYYLESCMRGFIDRKKEDENVISYDEIDTEIINNCIVVISTDGDLSTHMYLQLISKGFSRDSIFFWREWERLFLPIYALFRMNIVVSAFVSIQFTSICNLKCKGCLAFCPETRNKRFYGIEEFRDNVDSLFRNVDYIDMLDVGGGEPFLNDHVAECIDYVGRYRDRVRVLRVIVNGTAIPSDRICTSFANNNVWVWIDNYDSISGENKHIDEIIKKLTTYGIDHDIRCVDKWIDLQIDKNTLMSEKEGAIRFDECMYEANSVFDMRLFPCCYSGYAYKAEKIMGENDFLDISGSRRVEKSVITEFMLGYNTKGYLEMCRRCSGAETINSCFISVAEQLQKNVTGE